MEDRAELVGRQVGDFRLLEVIGEGGMGIAYRAEQLSLRREAVVKVLSTPASSEEAKLRFLREARLASRLDHPYAAHVYAFGADDGVLWIAMELVRGIPLDRLIEDQGAIPLDRFVPLFDRLCEVIHSAHEQGIIHRDIKPSNVMVVRRAGRLLPKLLDFGIARGSEIQAPDSLPRETADAPLDDRALTVDGRIGSPGYMAPETWLDPRQASPQSDLYSLAITGYEMLTARRLFTGKTVLQVARAHARAEIPPLGPGFPAGLDHVFARALAKLPAQRYRDVLELGAAMREVARAAVPEAMDLDEVVRDTFITGGPQPLAEALLDLSAARGASKAWDVGWRVVDVLVRVVGVMALASRVGVGERLDAESVAHVRALVERGLGTDEWFALIGSLVEPFVADPQGHPLPELVAAFAKTGEARRLFDELGKLRRTDGVEPRHVQTFVSELAKVLRACTFLTDYTWVAATERGEVWMGPRRSPRDQRELPAAAARGSVWLLDRDGAPVVHLSPLVQVAPPSPGADDELFLIDGPAKRGARCVAWPREFERYDEELWRYVADQLAPLRGQAARADREDAVPYRGLASFGPGDTVMFYGREREVEAVVNRLRVQSLIAVVGPSGVGKSSFVHAGVLPALPETWQTLTLRPGPLPLAALEARLVAAGLAVAGLADRLAADPGVLRQVLDDAARRQGMRFVIVIDQLEEIFTQCRDVATRDQFARSLAGIGGGRSDGRVILTLRDDFLVRTAELPGLGALLNMGLELITLPDPTALARILVEPLKQVGYTFESAKMPGEMIAEVREHPGALALLSFAASKLWDLRDRGFRHIPRRAYASIGGVVGALAKHAEDTLGTLSENHHKLVRELFRHLVTSEGTRATLYRAEAIQLLGKSLDAERVIETLVERRLVVAYEGDAKSERIEVIHEALLTAWPRLVTWQREDAEGARMRDQVRSAARQWGERGRPKGLLWRGEALVELKLWQSRHGGALTDLEHAFAVASIADEARSRRLRRLALATVVVGLAIGLVVLQRANGVARRNALTSRRAELAMLVEQGRTSLVGGHPQEAMVYLSEAYARGAADPNLPFMLGAGKRALAGQLLAMHSDTLGVKGAVATPDGTRIVSSELEGWVRIWNARTGQLEHSIRGSKSTSPYHTPAIVDDRNVLTFGPEEVPIVWDLVTGQQRFELPVGKGVMAQVSGDGTTIVTVENAKLRTWSAIDGTPRGQRSITPGNASGYALRVAGDNYALLDGGRLSIGRLDFAAPATAVATLHFSAGINGHAISLDGAGRHVAAVNDREVWVWDVIRGGEPRTLVGHRGEVWRAEFSPDGARLATASGDHTAKIWDVASGRTLVSLDGHEGFVGTIAWSPDGTRVVTGSADHTVRLWDARTGASLAVFYGHTDGIVSVRFDRAGNRVISASNDGTVRVFDARPSSQGFDLHHDGPLTLASHDARHLLIVGHDSRAWLYDLTARQLVANLGPYAETTELPRIQAAALQSHGDLDRSAETAVIPAGSSAVVVRFADRDHPLVLPHGARVTCARFAADGRIVTGLLDGKVAVWSATGKQERLFAHGTLQIADIAFDRDTTRFAVASGDGVKLYDLQDRALARSLPSLVSDTGLAFSHDGSWLAAAGDDTIARVCELPTGTLRFGTQGLSAMNGVALSPDDRRVNIANQEGSLTTFDSANGRVLGRLGDARSSGWMTGIVAYDDQIVTADDLGQVRFWPITLETRSPELVTREITCTIPLQLVETGLIPRTPPVWCR